MTGKVVIVTGCSKGGIGFAMCEEFAVHGCKVYATARRVEDMEGSTHPNISALKLDVTSDADVAEVVKTVLDREGNIDILVNNAGRPCSGPLMEVPLDLAQKTLDTNLLSALRLSQAMFPHMATKKRGTIVNIGSVAGDTPSPWGGVYGASKAGLVRLSEVLYMELAPLGIHVMHVSPGGVKTNIGTNTIAQINTTFREDSFYKAYFESMIRRVQTTQGPLSITAEQFAEQTVKEIIKAVPPRYMTLGAGAWLNAALQWFPRAFVCWLMWRLVAGKPRA